MPNGKDTLPNDHATHIRCMDGVCEPGTRLAKRLSGKRYVDEIARAGTVGTVAQTGDLPQDVWRQVDISVNHHGSRDVVVSSHYPGCAGFQGTREEHEAAVKQTAELVRGRYASLQPPVRAYPVLIERTDPKRERIHRLG